MSDDLSTGRRAAVHAALADPRRLEIVDDLSISDRTPTELCTSLGVASNLLAHHLAVLEEAGIIERQASVGDARRRYVRLVPGALAAVAEPTETLAARQVLFVCSGNSARSQLAAAAWNARHDVPATSAGTRPADRVQPGAVRAAKRAGLDLAGARPRSLDDVTGSPDLIVTVCDVAHEELPAFSKGARLLHWSVPDPVPDGSSAAFDQALERISMRIDGLAPRVRPAGVGARS